MTPRSAFGVLLALLLLAPIASAAHATVAVLERLSGEPTIYEVGPGGARKVSLPRQGASYTLPIEIETGPEDSALFRLPDSEVSVAPNTVMRVAAPEPEGGGLLQRIFQSSGSSLFSVDRRNVEHFQVETPYLVSVVKGTQFTVVVHDDGATVSLHEGRLQVNSVNGRDSVMLAPGDVAYSSTDGTLEKISYTMAGRSPLTDDAAALDRSAAVPVERVDGTVPGLGEVTPLRDASLAGLGGAADLSGDGGALAGLDDPMAGPGLAAGMNGGLAGGEDLLGDTGGGLVEELGDSAGDLLGSTGGAAADLVSDLGAGTGDLVGDLGAGTGDLVGDLGGSAGDLVGDLTGGAGDLVGDVGGSAGDVVGDLGATAGDLLGGSAGDLVGDLSATAGDLVGDTTATTGDLVSDVGASAGDLAGDLTDTTGDAVGDLAGTAGDLTGDVTSSAGDLVSELAGGDVDVGGTVGDVTGDLGDAAGDLTGNLADTTGDLAGDLADTTGDLTGDLQDAGNELTESLGSGLEETLGGLGGLLGGLRL